MTNLQQSTMAESAQKQTPVIEAKQVSVQYEEASGQTIEILKSASLAVYPGEMVSIIGASGSGKSTLLHILGLLDHPTSGSVYIHGEAVGGLNEKQRSRLRNQSLGFVYQFHHLLPEFSALDNVAMPLIVRRESRAAAREQAAVFLEQVGLAHRIHHYPGQLSGGERQRVALARALVNQPACVLADEPTGNLDRHTADDMFALLRRINADLGTALVIVTHDQSLAALAHRRLLMSDGTLASAEVAE